MSDRSNIYITSNLWNCEIVYNLANVSNPSILIIRNPYVSNLSIRDPGSSKPSIRDPCPYEPSIR